MISERGAENIERSEYVSVMHDFVIIIKNRYFWYLIMQIHI